MSTLYDDEIEAFVGNLFDNAIDTPDFITAKEAREWINSFKRDDPDSVPEDITPEEFADIWNEWVEEDRDLNESFEYSDDVYYAIDDSYNTTEYDSLNGAMLWVEDNLSSFKTNPTICEYDSDGEFTGNFWEYVDDDWVKGTSVEPSGNLKESFEDEKLWYAVMRDREDDDWGYGSYDLDKALDMAREYGGDAYIAVISEGKNGNSLCVDEITLDEDGGYSRKYEDTYLY